MALQLRDLCNEKPVHVVARNYGMPRGIVQTLAQTCQGFAAGMIKFCAQMDWGYARRPPLMDLRNSEPKLTRRTVSWQRPSTISPIG